jgi:hypothetical protein
MIRFFFFFESKKHQLHKSSQINGALMHIRQLFEDFKQSKIKNTAIIKELHLNTLMYLPSVSFSQLKIKIFPNENKIF